MSLANSFYDFKKEIELIIRQNPLECELYSIIAAIIRERDSSKNFSLRDVSSNKRITNRQNQEDRMYKTSENICGASDFLIIKPDYCYSKGETSKIVGSIEVKSLSLELDTEIKNNRSQFDGILKTFKKLIYTNGIVWHFYKYDSNSGIEELVWEVILGKYSLCDKEKEIITDEDEIIWEPVSEWHLLLGELDKLNWDE